MSLAFHQGAASVFNAPLAMTNSSWADNAATCWDAHKGLAVNSAIRRAARSAIPE
jgi:hypothetical protein